MPSGCHRSRIVSGSVERRNAGGQSSKQYDALPFRCAGGRSRRILLRADRLRRSRTSPHRGTEGKARNGNRKMHFTEPKTAAEGGGRAHSFSGSAGSKPTGKNVIPDGRVPGDRNPEELLRQRRKRRGDGMRS